MSRSLLLLLALPLAITACGGSGGSSSSADTSSAAATTTTTTPTTPVTPAVVVATPSASFDIAAAGTVALMPADPTTALDPTVAANSPSGSTPYFKAQTGLTVDSVKALMADTTTFPRAEDPVVVTVGTDSYKGWRLADVVVRATRFRPADYNTGAFGVTTAIIASGTANQTAVFSFTELVRSANGEKTIVAYQKNGAALPDAEGSMEVIAANDTDTSLRRVAQLSHIGVRNEYLATSYTLPSSATSPAVTPDARSFQVTGDVTRTIDITAPVISRTSDQGYYSVTMVGTADAASFATYYFDEYGPRHMYFWYGQGIRLTDVIDNAGLAHPNEKNRCFVVIRNANNQHALFSCGELYNSTVGIGDGAAGVAARSRSKGVLLVTDDFRSGTGNGVMMSCWNDLSTCTKNDPTNPAAYTIAMDANGDKVNDQSIALISTEDKLPFIPFGRWYPMPTSCASAVWQCNAWIDVGERLQQNIKSITVYYVGSA